MEFLPRSNVLFSFIQKLSSLIFQPLKPLFSKQAF